jgi:hypothetical protein
VAHLLYMKEQRFSTGTWGGAILSGFTLMCGSCKRYSCVRSNVITLGGSIYNANSCEDLYCPYCGVKDSVKLDNKGQILQDNTYCGDD